MTPFEQSVQKAREYERAVSAWLRIHGYLVLPVYDFSGFAEGKAPKLEAFDPCDSLVLPDLLRCRAGMRSFVEVKQKQHADYTRITGRYETGISLRLWKHYLLVKEVSGIDVWLCFLHRDENEVLAGEVSALELLPPRIYSGSKMGRHGMVFFPCERLQYVCSLDNMLVPEAA